MNKYQEPGVKTTPDPKYALILRGTGFIPLPREEWGHVEDVHGRRRNFCCCQYCSPTREKSVEYPEGVYDTLATDLATGKQWKVHFPEIHGRPLLRPTF